MLSSGTAYASLNQAAVSFSQNGGSFTLWGTACSTYLGGKYLVLKEPVHNPAKLHLLRVPGRRIMVASTAGSPARLLVLKVEVIAVPCTVLNFSSFPVIYYGV